jgi:hypothetical protein
MFDRTAAPPDIPDDAEDPAARVLRDLAVLGGEDREEWSGAARAARVQTLAEITDRAQAELIRATGSWDAVSAWAEDGACSPVAWLVHFTRTAKARATRLVRSARLTRAHERTAKALAAADISSDHVDRLAEAARHREHLYADHEDVLLDAAATMNLADFQRVTDTWRAYADDARANAEAAAAVEHAYVDAGPTFGGRVVMNAELDPEGGAIVLAAIDARCRPDPQIEGLRPRSLAERRATALIEMAADSLERRSQGGRAPVGIDVIIDVATLTGAAFAGDPSAREPFARDPFGRDPFGRDPFGSAGVAAAFAPRSAEELAAMRCELGTGSVIPPQSARRLACDATVARVLMRGASEVLDLGRRTRVVSAPQRRALVHRDGGCVFPGCDRPDPWCDAHHLVHWTRGGPTDLDNLVLLCRRHHVAVHERGWKLARDPTTDRWMATRPP